MPLAALSIDLTVSMAKLQQGLDKAARLSEKESARMAKAFAGVREIAAGIGAGLVAGLSVSAFTAFIDRTNAGLLAIKDLSEATGSTIENVSGLENAIRAGGGTLADVTPVLVKFNGVLKDADGKNGISQALRAIGLDAAELRAKDPAEALLDVSRALQGFNDDGNKARLVQELFGKSVAEVVPLLNDLADNGLVASENIRQQAEEADRFEKSLAKLDKTINYVSRSIAGPLVDSLNDYGDRIKELLGGDKSEFTLNKEVTELRLNLEKLKGLRGEGFTVAGFFGSEAQREAEIAKIEGQLSDALRRFYRLNDGQAGGGRGFVLPLRNVGDLPGLGETSRRGASQARQALQLPPEATGPGPFAAFEVPEALTAGLRALEQTDFQRLQDLQNTMRELLTLEGINGTSPALVEALQKTKDQLDALDPATQLAREQTERLLQIMSQTPGGTLASVLSDIDLINGAFRTGKIDAEQWAQAVRQASAPLRKVADDGKDANNVARDLGLSFQSAAEDAIVLGKGASEVLRGLEQDIIRIITRELVTKSVAKGITGLLQGVIGDGGLSGFLGGLFGGGAGAAGAAVGAAGSGFLSSLFGGFFAEGGYLPPGKWGWAGERGPEPIFGGRTGLTVQPAGGAGGLTMTNHFHISGPVTRETQAQIAAQAARAVERANRRNN